MSEVHFENINKKFDQNHVVKDFTLHIPKGHFCSFLGPSGCGKTTILRMLAGLENPTSGKIQVDNECFYDSINTIDLPVEKRNLGMVFQSYAIWPHLNVFDNIAFPLKIKKAAKSEIQDKVDEIIKTVELTGLEKRMPNQLSGGQQQRVALARGLVYSPGIVLLDEPLSNLDAKLRDKMREDIRAIQQEKKFTAVYVTHDQIEAFTMSDKIVVLNEGIIQQEGSPQEIRENPSCDFVENFIN
ncbi:ABC transporter ATP-binding protein [Bacteriovoracaceae bacterium]|nr:ABC transporter ATP-binding protein [Bacteriovoracaceae bacterium]